MQIPIIPFRGQKKPWGSIPRINWAHPLAANLASYCYDAGGVLIDLVNGGVGSNVTATTAARGVGSFGSGYKYTSGGGAIKLPFTSRINSITPPASIACSFFVTAAPASGVFFVLADSAGDNPIYCAADSDTVMRQGFNSGPGDLTYTVASVINGYHSMVGVGATTALVQAYFDGAFQTSAANNPTATAPGVQPVFNSFNSASLTGNTTAGFIHYGALWRRKITSAEAMQLHKDPYCFLIYPEDEMFATLVGVAAATTSEDRFHQPWSSVGRRYAIIAAG